MILDRDKIAAALPGSGQLGMAKALLMRVQGQIVEPICGGPNLRLVHDLLKDSVS